MDSSTVAMEELHDAWKGGDVSTVKASDLYRMGMILQQLSTNRNSQQQQHAYITALQSSYHNVLTALPTPYRRQIFSTLLLGFTQLLKITDSNHSQQDNNNNESSSIFPATQALSQLYQSSPLAEASSSTTLDALRSISSFYHNSASISSSSSLSESLVTLLILLLRLATPVAPDLGHNDILHQHQSEQTTDQEGLWAFINALQEEGLWSTVSAQLNQENPNWRDNLLQTLLDPDQRDYFATMLDTTTASTSSQQDPISWSHPESKAKTSEKKASSSIHSNDPLQPLIDQVAAIIPGLGQGFIETALSIYHGNVEQTVSALLLLDDPSAQSQLPAQLFITDRSLPRRRKLTAKQMQQQEDEAKQVTKATIQAMEAQQQTEANLLSQALTQQHNEYDDDYDDRWDDTDGMASGADSGLYDDYQAVKAYNKVYREMEADQSFWEENRNTNRQAGGNNHKNQKSADGGKAYRGPDKLKGGRVPHPHAGGRGGGGRRGKNPKNTSNDKDNKTDATEKANEGTESTGDNSDTKKGNSNNHRRKNKALAKRREQQKKAMYSKSG